MVNALNNNLTFTLPSGWSVYPEFKDFGNLSGGNLSYELFNVTVASGTTTGNHTIIPEVNWTNPEGNTNASTTTISVNVTSTRILNLTTRNATLIINHSKQKALTFGT